MRAAAVQAASPNGGRMSFRVPSRRASALPQPDRVCSLFVLPAAGTNDEVWSAKAGRPGRALIVDAWGLYAPLAAGTTECRSWVCNPETFVRIVPPAPRPAERMHWRPAPTFDRAHGPRGRMLRGGLAGTACGTARRQRVPLSPRTPSAAPLAGTPRLARARSRRRSLL